MKIIKNKYLCFIASFVLACGVAFALPSGEDMSIYNKVVRIHVIANSDSDSDQQLKYKVRDEVIQLSQMLISDCRNLNRAEQILKSNLSLIQKTAKQAVEKEGMDYGVKVDFSREYYPTREYQNFRLPAGRYRSLRICIGKAEGKNWWCVIYPAFCLKASTTPTIPIIDKNPGKAYKIKFKLLEWLGKFSKQKNISLFF